MGAGFNDNEDDAGKPAHGSEGAMNQDATGQEATEEAAGELADVVPPAEDPGAALAAGDVARLDLKDDDERLPWLESEDDEDEGEGGTAGKAAGVVLGAILALVVLVGGIWWVSHPRDDTEQVAAGGVIEAPEQPYKEAPEDPGGKTFAGTGDSSFKVSEGQTAPARLGQASPPASPAPKAQAPAAASSGAPAAPVSGVGVQIAAYSNEAQAKAGWDRLSTQYEALKGVPHRIQEGRADIGTVYRLQAVAPDAAGAQALCGRLKSAGLACQVKN